MPIISPKLVTCQKEACFVLNKDLTWKTFLIKSYSAQKAENLACFYFKIMEKKPNKEDTSPKQRKKCCKKLEEKFLNTKIQGVFEAIIKAIALAVIIPFDIFTGFKYTSSTIKGIRDSITKPDQYFHQYQTNYQNNEQWKKNQKRKTF